MASLRHPFGRGPTLGGFGQHDEADAAPEPDHQVGGQQVRRVVRHPVHDREQHHPDPTRDREAGVGAVRAPEMDQAMLAQPALCARLAAGYGRKPTLTLPGVLRSSYGPLYPSSLRNTRSMKPRMKRYSSYGLLESSTS